MTKNLDCACVCELASAFDLTQPTMSEQPNHVLSISGYGMNREISLIL